MLQADSFSDFPFKICSKRLRIRCLETVYWRNILHRIIHGQESPALLDFTLEIVIKHS
jgi:hypothetical protein